MKSYLTIVTLCFVLVIVVFVGHHLDTPGRADRERSTLLGGGSGVGDRVAAIGQINVAVAKEESSADETTSVEVATAASAAVDGQQVYNAGCVACHGARRDRRGPSGWGYRRMDRSHCGGVGHPGRACDRRLPR